MLACNRAVRASRYRVGLVAVSLLLCCLPAVARVTPSQAQEATDPVALRQRLFDGIASGDVQATLNLFTDDAVYFGINACAQVCKGREQIQQEIERLTAVHLQVTPTQTDVAGDTVTGTFQAVADSAKAVGADRLLGNSTVQVRGDKIAMARVQLDISDPQTATFSKAVFAGRSGTAADQANVKAKDKDGGGFPVGALLFLLGLAALVLIPAGVAISRLRAVTPRPG
jgi:uncharacterized protein (TIGR02246 family)